RRISLPGLASRDNTSYCGADAESGLIYEQVRRRTEIGQLPGLAYFVSNLNQGSFSSHRCHFPEQDLERAANQRDAFGMVVQLVDLSERPLDRPALLVFESDNVFRLLSQALFDPMLYCGYENRFARGLKKLSLGFRISVVELSVSLLFS